MVFCKRFVHRFNVVLCLGGRIMACPTFPCLWHALEREGRLGMVLESYVCIFLTEHHSHAIPFLYSLEKWHEKSNSNLWVFIPTVCESCLYFILCLTVGSPITFLLFLPVLWTFLWEERNWWKVMANRLTHTKWKDMTDGWKTLRLDECWYRMSNSLMSFGY